MLDLLAELARSPKTDKVAAPPNIVKKKVKKAAPAAQAPADNKGDPEWWSRMNDAGRATYLRMHPKTHLNKNMKSEMREFLSKKHDETESSRIADVKAALKANPEDRAKLRKVTKQIARNPDEALKPDFQKIDEAADKPVSEEDRQDIENAVNEAGKKGGSHNIMHALGKIALIAGVVTIGGALLATGGLPYAILTMHVIKNSHEAYKDVKQRVKSGEDTVKACFGALSSAIHRSVKDPAVVAAALMVAAKKKHHGDDDKQEQQRQENKEKLDEHKRKNADAKVKQNPGRDKQSTTRTSKDVQPKAKPAKTPEADDDDDDQDQGDVDGKHDSNRIKL